MSVKLVLCPAIHQRGKIGIVSGSGTLTMSGGPTIMKVLGRPLLASVLPVTGKFCRCTTTDDEETEAIVMIGEIDPRRRHY